MTVRVKSAAPLIYERRDEMTARDMDKILDEAFKKVFGDRW